MPFLQYPWRWLEAVEAPMAIFFVAAIWPSTSARSVPSSSPPAPPRFWQRRRYAGTYFFQVCYPEDTVASTLADYRAGAGFEGMYEYEPPGGETRASPPAFPMPASSAIHLSFSASRTPTIPAPTPFGAPTRALATPHSRPSTATRPIRSTAESAPRSPEPGYLVLRLVSYPAWTIAPERPARSRSQPKRDDGLIVVPVPQARSI